MRSRCLGWRHVYGFKRKIVWKPKVQIVNCRNIYQRGKFENLI
jgi:hypothetical protein